MFVDPSGVNVSSSALRFLAGRLREHRRTLGTRWRRLNAGRQALLALAHLRNGQPYVQLAAGFGSAPPPPTGTSPRQSSSWPPSLPRSPKLYGPRR